MSFRVALVALALVPTLALGTRAAPARLQIRLFSFAPKTVSIAAGDALVVTNGDDTEHTITFGTPAKKDARLAAHVLARGDSATITTKTPGTYAFYCERHPFMTGTLTVTP